MNLAQLRARFRAVLNREDCSVEEADEFLSQGLGRIQRELRTPAMERVYYLDTAIPLTTMELPVDYLEMIDVLANGTPLERAPYRDMLRRRGVLGGAPELYARYTNTLYFRPAVPPGMRVELLYYGEFKPLENDQAVNELSTSAPDLWIYAALVFAGDHFQHDNRAEWEQRYQMILDQVRQQAAQDELAGPLAVQPMYMDPGV